MRFNTNDMTAAFRNSLDDLAASYTLRFYSDADDESGIPGDTRQSSWSDGAQSPGVDRRIGATC